MKGYVFVFSEVILTLRKISGVISVLKLKSIVLKFFEFADRQSIEIYNEFSLQHELGIFLREAFTTHPHPQLPQ